MKKKLIIFSSIAIISIILFIILAAIVNNDITTPTKLDISCRDFFYNIRGNKDGFLYYFNLILTKLASAYAVIIIGFLIILLTKFDNKAISYIIGALLMILINYALKDIYQRERPTEALRWIAENDYSFPSGHATSASFMFMFIAYFLYDSNYKKVIKIVGYVLCAILIILVPTTRLVFGVHYITDIMGGLLNGIFATSISIIIMIIFKEFKIFDKPIFTSIYEYIKKDKKDDIKEPEEKEKTE